MEYDELKKELIKYWDSLSDLESGEVVKILHKNERGVNGFIKSNKGEFYFSIPAKIKISKFIEIGSKVLFEINGDRARVVRIKT